MLARLDMSNDFFIVFVFTCLLIVYCVHILFKMYTPVDSGPQQKTARRPLNNNLCLAIIYFTICVICCIDKPVRPYFCNNYYR